jgi:hypothetical protein
MIKIVCGLVLLLIVSSNHAMAAGIDEVYIRPGNGWGIDFFQKAFNRTGFGKSYGVVIGIGDYENYASLDAPAQDAAKFRDFLKYDAGFDYVIMLTDDKANKARIEGLMEESLPEMIKPGDRVLFYFSGHGATRKLSDGKKRGYLILGDSGTKAWDTMIDMPRLMEWAQNVDTAQHVLFVIDACFSGLAAYQVKAVDVAAKTVERLSQPAHHIVTAGIEDEESYSINGESIFTSEFLAAARGRLAGEPDGIISLSEIMFNVGRAIDRRRAELGERVKMSPHMYETRLEERDEGEFFFLAKPTARETPIAPLVPAPGATTPRALEVEKKRGDTDSLPDAAAAPGIEGNTTDAPVAHPFATPAPDELAWNFASSSRDPKTIEAFIEKFPSSALRAKAEALLTELLKLANLPPAQPAAVPRLPPTAPPSGAPITTPESTPPTGKVAPTHERPGSLSPPANPKKAIPTRSVHARASNSGAGHCFIFNGSRYCN